LSRSKVTSAVCGLTRYPTVGTSIMSNCMALKTITTITVRAISSVLPAQDIHGADVFYARQSQNDPEEECGPCGRVSQGALPAWQWLVLRRRLLPRPPITKPIVLNRRPYSSESPEGETSVDRPALTTVDSDVRPERWGRP
jgi:hypothetical protein